VEVGTALGGEGVWWLPLAGERDGVGNIAALNRKGKLVDADTARTECRAAIDAVRDLLCNRSSFGYAVSSFARHPGVGSQDCGTHAQRAVHREQGDFAGRRHRTRDGVDDAQAAAGVLPGKEQLGAHVGAHHL
jgi:hypothetical protein